ncbi:MAG: molybdenum cofactor guanylyltransferase [Deltaproteobacteria bacterium]|nr:molybdenum cofactor guanylyltransferase [Deltaproteobacteria bacterium]
MKPIDDRNIGKSLAGVTGVILAGGRSSRMGSNKALLPYRGGRFIEAIHRLLSGIFAEVILVTNHPEQYEFLPCRKVSDRYPGLGALAGLHAGLYHGAAEHILAVACDMPYLNSALIRRLALLRYGADVVIPEGESGAEPLHAIYGRGCLPFMEEALAADERRIVSFFHRVRVKRFSQGEVAAIDPGFDSFRNINTPDEYYCLRKGEIKNGAQPDALRFHAL